MIKALMSRVYRVVMDRLLPRDLQVLNSKQRCRRLRKSKRRKHNCSVLHGASDVLDVSDRYLHASDDVKIYLGYTSLRVLLKFCRYIAETPRRILRRFWIRLSLTSRHHTLAGPGHEAKRL
jgi:hypothetical protein